MTLTTDGYRPRLIDNELKRCLSIFDAVTSTDLNGVERPGQHTTAATARYSFRSQRILSEPLICPDGSHEIDDGAKSLLAMDRKIRGQEKGRPPEFMCVICGMSDAAYVRDDGIYVLPPTVLGP